MSYELEDQKQLERDDRINMRISAKLIEWMGDKEKIKQFLPELDIDDEIASCIVNELHSAEDAMYRELMKIMEPFATNEVLDEDEMDRS